MKTKSGLTVTESNEWRYTKDNVESDSDVTKYKVFNITWNVADFKKRLNSLKQGVKCWEIVNLGGQKVSLGVERQTEFTHRRESRHPVVEYEDWLDLSVRNVGEEIVWIYSVEVSLASPHHQYSQQCGSVDLHQNERVKDLNRFISVDRLRKEVLLNTNFSGCLETVWKIKVESGGVRPPLGYIVEERGELANHFWSLFQNSLLTDYTIVCGGEEIKVHRAVLAARSDYWRALLASGWVESESCSTEREITKETLYTLLEFIYTGRVQEKMEPRQMENLLEAANFYGVDSLKEQCEEGLILSLGPTNLVDRLVLADTFSATQLRRVAKQMLIQNVDMLTDIPDWKQKLETRISLALEVMEGLAVARANSTKTIRRRNSLEYWVSASERVADHESDNDSEDFDGDVEVQGGVDDLQGGNNVLFNDGVPVAQMM